MRNLRDYTGRLLGEHKQVTESNMNFKHGIERFDRFNTNDRYKFFKTIRSIAYNFEFINFTELFECLIELDDILQNHKSNSKDTYIKQLNSLVDIAVVDFSKELNKVYDNNNQVKENPENFDEFIKIMLSKSKEIFG